MKRERIFNLIISLLGIILIVNIGRSIIDLWQKGEIIKDYENRLTKVQKEQEDLKKELERLGSPEYIEKQAREKLNLGKEGEYVVILPPITPKPTPQVADNLPNWQRWLKLFF